MYLFTHVWNLQKERLGCELASPSNVEHGHERERLNHDTVGEESYTRIIYAAHATVSRDGPCACPWARSIKRVLSSHIVPSYGISYLPRCNGPQIRVGRGRASTIISVRQGARGWPRVGIQDRAGVCHKIHDEGAPSTEAKPAMGPSYGSWSSRTTTPSIGTEWKQFRPKHQGERSGAPPRLGRDWVEEGYGDYIVI